MAQKTKKEITTKKATPVKEKAVKKTTVKKNVKKKTVAKKPTAKKLNTDFAVIAISGTQLKLREGDRYDIEKIEGEKGDKVEVKEVLMLSTNDKITVGKPYLEDAKVVLEIDSQFKGKKIEGFKYKAKSRYRKKYGYRPQLTRITVKKIG